MSARLVKREDWPKLARRADYSVAKLARLCGVSVRQLQRLYKEATGMSPKQWLLRERQRASLQSLAQPGSLIKQVAAELGYKHPQHFSRDFKIWHACAPTEHAPSPPRESTSE